MEMIIYTYWDKASEEKKTFEGENAAREKCIFACELAFPNRTNVREIQLWTDGEKTLTIRP